MKEAKICIMEMEKPSFCICAVFHCDINGSTHKFTVKTKDLGTSRGKFPRRMAMIGSFHFYQKSEIHVRCCQEVPGLKNFSLLLTKDVIATVASYTLSLTAKVGLCTMLSWLHQKN